MAPRLSLALHETAAARDEKKLNQLINDYVVDLYEFRTRRKGYEVTVMKAMMDLIGLKGGPSRPPLVEVTDSERQELQDLLDRWKPML